MYLVYGNVDIARLMRDDLWKIYSFTSLAQDFPDTGLIPPNNLGAINEYDFDVKYMQFIMNDDFRFIKFMDIMYNIYNHKNLFLVINYEDWSINLVESLLKLIQQRYGINATMINEIDDINIMKDTDFDSYYGINNFDQDCNRYLEISERYRIMNGGTVYKE